MSIKNRHIAIAERKDNPGSPSVAHHCGELTPLSTTRRGKLTMQAVRHARHHCRDRSNISYTRNVMAVILINVIEMW
jgi:hypothetical protein